MYFKYDLNAKRVQRFHFSDSDARVYIEKHQLKLRKIIIKKYSKKIILLRGVKNRG